MAPKIPAHKLDDAVSLYLSGEPMEKIQASTGISLTSLYRVFRARGIPSRKTRTDIPMTEIVRKYEAGSSLNALSREYAVSRGAIAKRMTDMGIELRDMSAAGKARNEALSESERKAQVAEANKAARNRRVPEIEKFRRALAVERTGRPSSPGEALLKAMLEQRGYSPAIERAVGPYNIDLSVLPVAVEVLGGGFHGVKSRHRERTPYILDSGWHLVMVWDHEGSSALGPGAAEYLVSFIEQVRRNPPATCQYRVISGNGKLLAACGREDNEFPLVPPPRGRV